LLALGLVAVLLVQGGGFMSLDGLLAGRTARSHSA
jgi:hypothetical protein